MAKIGLSNFRYAVLTEAADGTPNYGTVKTPAKAVSCSVQITNNSAKLFADDGLAESDTSFQSGTVTIGIDDEDLETMATLLGHTYQNGTILRNTADAAPYVGLGRIVTKMVNGAYRYKVEFLAKVKFAEPNQEDATKGESLEFTTSQLEGTVAALASGKWSDAKVFTTKADAVSYLESLFGNVTFTLAGAVTKTLTAKTNMTWAEWISSSMNTIKAFVDVADSDTDAVYMIIDEDTVPGHTGYARTARILETINNAATGSEVITAKEYQVVAGST